MCPKQASPALCNDDCVAGAVWLSAAAAFRRACLTMGADAAAPEAGSGHSVVGVSSVPDGGSGSWLGGESAARTSGGCGTMRRRAKSAWAGLCRFGFMRGFSGQPDFNARGCYWYRSNLGRFSL